MADETKGGRAGGTNSGRGRNRGRGGQSGHGRGRGNAGGAKGRGAGGRSQHRQHNDKKGSGRGDAGCGGKGNSGAGGRGRNRPRSSSHSEQQQHEYYMAKKSIEGPYSHLFCSERHAFALSRVLIQQIKQDPPKHMQHMIGKQDNAANSGHVEVHSLSRQQMLQRYNHILLPSQPKLTGSDASTSYPKLTSDQLEKWWEAVKLVRCHVPIREETTNNSSKYTPLATSLMERCPICLDEEMVCPFIAPCGHSFCLPCVLGYLGSVANDLNKEAEIREKKKKMSAATVSSGRSGRIRSDSTASAGSNGGNSCIPSLAAAARVSVTTVRARCPLCSSGSSTELNAGEAMITYRDLRPIMFVPVVEVTASTVNSGGDGRNNRRQSNTHLGTRMNFTKLHRVRGCPAPYTPLDGKRIRGAYLSTSCTEYCHLPDLPDGDDETDECTFARQYYAGVNEYERALTCCLNDLKSYRESNVHCRIDPREDWNVSMAIEAIHAAQRRWSGGDAGRSDGGFRRMELDAKLGNRAVSVESRMVDAVSREEVTSPSCSGHESSTCDRHGAKATSCPGRGSDPINEISRADEMKPSANEDDSPKLTPPTAQHKSQTMSAFLQPGTAYLHCSDGQHNMAPKAGKDDFDECLFYQSSDGQLCFLSGIDVACLMHEFSLHQKVHVALPKGEEDVALDKESIISHETAKTLFNQSRNNLPLPDEITGTVIGMENMVVTQSLIKRKPFLSHIPFNSTVSFVEIDWYSGGDKQNKPMLSPSTLSKFKGELQRRKSERVRAAKNEHKADMAAKAKLEKEERRRREHLLGPMYLDGTERQSIDPEDDFFQIRSDSIEETKEDPIFKFNQVCATGGVWPELASSVKQDHASSMAHTPIDTTLSPSLAQTSSPWSNRKKVSAISAAKSRQSEFPTLAESSASNKPQAKQHLLSPLNSTSPSSSRVRPWGV